MQYINPFILCFCRFIAVFQQRAKFNKNLLTPQGKKVYIQRLFLKAPSFGG
jgi:hypothetical protein